MIVISSAQIAQISCHAMETYPEECCGLLIGKVEEKKKIVRVIRETENDWGNDDDITFAGVSGSKRNRFSISPQVLLQTQKEVREQQLCIVGIYHSHPDAAAIPSEFDRQIAWPEYSYLIASVTQGEVVAVRSWLLDGSYQFQEEKIL